VLVYLRQSRVIHRDLKPTNIFLADKLALRVGDFGVALKLEPCGEPPLDFCGSPLFMAPEVINVNKTTTGYSFESDVWSAGIVFYMLLYGCCPFTGKNQEEIFDQINQGFQGFPAGPDKVSEEAKDLITRILYRNPKKRLDLD
jgi:polo-like kinase 1